MTPNKTTIDLGAAQTKAMLSLGAMFEEQGYSPHRIQKLVHAARFGKQKARFRTVDAGRRTGKSNLGGHELAIEAMRMPVRLQTEDLSRTGRRAEFWIVGPEYDDSEKEFRVLYDTLKKLGADFDQPGTYYSPAGGQLSI